MKKTIASLQASPTAILPRPIFSHFTGSYVFPLPTQAMSNLAMELRF